MSVSQKQIEYNSGKDLQSSEPEPMQPEPATMAELAKALRQQAMTKEQITVGMEFLKAAIDAACNVDDWMAEEAWYFDKLSVVVALQQAQTYALIANAIFNAPAFTPVTQPYPISERLEDWRERGMLWSNGIHHHFPVMEGTMEEESATSNALVA